MELKGKTSEEIVESFCDKHSITNSQWNELFKQISKSNKNYVFKEIIAIITLIICIAFLICLLIAATNSKYSFPYIFENANHNIYLLFINITYVILIILIPIIIAIFCIGHLIKE